jgi:magnesium-transporting ATPase (P-type)
MSETESCSEVTDECPVSATLYGYRPHLAGNAILCLAFAVCVLLQLGSLICLRVRTWSYMIVLLIGTIVEVLGYMGRLVMNNNPWSTLGVASQLICLIVAPSFIAAAMSVTFKHIIVYCGASYSWIRPRFVPWVMIGTDFAGIVIQFIGSAIVAGEVTQDEPDSDRVDLGNNIIIFGVCFQAFIMLISGLYMGWYWWRLKKGQPKGNYQNFPMAMNNLNGGGQYQNGAQYQRAGPYPGPAPMDMAANEGLLPAATKGGYDQHRATNSLLVTRFKRFVTALIIAYVLVFIRCIYRCIEMASGWGSEIMQDEPSFLILDGAMVALAVIILTVFQPGFWFAPMMRKKSFYKLTAQSG